VVSVHSRMHVCEWGSPHEKLEPFAAQNAAVAAKTFLGGLTERAQSTTLIRRHCAI